MLSLLKDNKEVDQLKENDEGMIIVNQTPFYGESGGQVGDNGEIVSNDFKFEVTDVQKKLGDLFVHYGKVKSGSIKLQESVELKIDEERRSVNEILSQSQTTLADQFGEQKILDLTKEIGLNERFLLTQNLFNGDAVLFEKTINRLNNCSSKEEALAFFKNDLAKTFDWNLKSTMVKKFIKLIERRYH